jgi:toxin YhaV
MKGMGLPNRYRLFFRAFTSEARQVLIILWLGYPRKAGDKADEIALRSPSGDTPRFARLQRAFHQARDCYEVFTKMVSNGDFPDNLSELLMATDE